MGKTTSLTEAEKEQYMQLAIAEAGKAEAQGEVPIGCVLVLDGEVIGRGHNRRKRPRMLPPMREMARHPGSLQPDRQLASGALPAVCHP